MVKVAHYCTVMNPDELNKEVDTGHEINFFGKEPSGS